MDAILPVWDVRSRHGVRLACEPERALAAALGVPVASDPLVRALLQARGLGARGTVGEAFSWMGFDTLVESPTEFVAGASGRPWRPRGHIRPFEEAAPGTVRIAASIRASAAADAGALLETETRVLAVDDAARIAFARYWRVVGPFSGLIRRRWLGAAARAIGV